jgi:phage shock protein C
VNPRRLYRSRDHQLAGVAGGMAEYLDIDPTFVRILWILAVLASAGLAIVAYVVLAIVIPQAPYAAAAPGSWAAGPGAPAAPGWSSAPPVWDARWAVPSDQHPAPSQARPRSVGIGAIVGVVLVVIGVLALVDVAIPGWVAGPLIGPAVILTLGAALLVASLRPRGGETAGPASVPMTGPDPAASSAVPAPSEPWATTDTEPVDPRPGAA